MNHAKEIFTQKSVNLLHIQCSLLERKKNWFMFEIIHRYGTDDEQWVREWRRRGKRLWLWIKLDFNSIFMLFFVETSHMGKHAEEGFELKYLREFCRQNVDTSRPNFNLFLRSNTLRQWNFIIRRINPISMREREKFTNQFMISFFCVCCARNFQRVRCFSHMLFMIA